jgi:hypothetical protein
MASANPDFYLAHFDVSGKSQSITKTAGPSGVAIPMDTFVRHGSDTHGSATGSV